VRVTDHEVLTLGSDAPPLWATAVGERLKSGKSAAQALGGVEVGGVW
jgi:hypothetical protein